MTLFVFQCAIAFNSPVSVIREAGAGGREVVGVGVRVACSKRSDSGERCEVKIAIKSRGGLGREVRVPSLTSPPPSLLFFSRPFLLRTAPHYLNAWNRLESGNLRKEVGLW